MRSWRTRVAIGALALLLASEWGAGQAGMAAGKSPFRDEPAGPRALPGDDLPPFGMMDGHGKLPPPPPLLPGVSLPGPGGPPESTAPGLDLAEATRVARAAVLACTSGGYRVGAAVIDSVGEARAMLTGDGSNGSHVFVAMRKAEVALAFGMPSSAARDQVARDPALMAKVTPAMFVAGGAVPIRRGGMVIGAVGVSGAAGKIIGRQDELCAMAGRRVLKASGR